MSKLINIRVIPNSKKDEVIQESDGLKVKITAPPVEGKANKALVELLAEYFNVKKNKIRIIKGEKSKNKVIMIVTGNE
ncbi:MAG: DUF167 domain-containing protein [bacterium]